MAAKPNSGRDIEAEVSALFTAAVGNGLQRPEDAWIVYTATEDAEDDGYGPGYVYVRRFKPNNPEMIAAQIRPSMRKYLVDGLCVKIERITRDPQGVEWQVIDLGELSFEQYLGTVPAEPVAATDLPDTAVTPGSYTAADITVDAKGRITAAANGSPDASNVTYTPSTPSDYDAAHTHADTAMDELASRTESLEGLVGGGAPDNAQYVTGVASAGLSDEIVIPGLRAAADIASAAGGGTSEEYDTATTGLTWSPSTPATVDSNTTVLSHLYVLSTDTTERFGFKAWSPAGAFDARCKLSIFSESAVNARGAGLMIANAGNTDRAMIVITQSALSILLQAYTYTGGAYTQRGTDINTGGNEKYLRITRDGSNNVTFYHSNNGLFWMPVGTFSFTFTPTQIGFRISSGAAASYGFGVDWLRTSV